MRLALPALLFLLSPLYCAATAIAVTFDRGTVYVAADSLLAVREAGGVTRQDTCKIIQSGEVVFAASGVLFLNRADVRNIARTAIETTPAIGEARAAFTEMVTPLLRTAFRWARRRQPSVPRVLAAAFVSHQGVRVVTLFDTGTFGDPVIEATYLDCGQECNRNTFLMLGSQASARARFPKLLRDRKLDGAHIAERLVQTEMDSNPGDVGGPLQLVRLSGHEISWVKRPPVCEEE